MTMPSRRHGGAGAWILAASALVTAAMASCTIVHGTGTTTGHPTSSSSGAGGAGGAGPGTGGDAVTPADTGRSIFESKVQPGMLNECGACHQLGGIADKPFLAAPDVYVSITTWPNAITSDPSLSILMTHPASASHGGGQAPDFSKALRQATHDWLTFEAAHIPKPDGGAGPSLAPFKPYLMGAFNAIYLDPLGPDFANSSLTFYAEELPQGAAKPTLLRLSDIEIHPIAGVQIHVVHPLFTVYPSEGGELPDTADSFSGFDQSYSIDSNTLSLGTGEIILSHWEKNARLGIAFEKIEAIKSGGTTATCKNVAKFKAEIVPLLGQTWPCAMQCHAGGNIQAQQQMDLSNLMADPPDDACAQVRARITPGDPDKSQILVVTNPLYPGVHGFKFAGNKNNYNSFKAAVTPWILAEQ